MNQVLQIITNIGQWLLVGLEGLVSFLNGIPAEYWAVAIASIPISGIVAVVKTWAMRKWDKAPSSTKMFLTNFGALVATAVTMYLSSTPSDDPLSAIFSMVGLGLLVQQPVYFRFIKPIIGLAWENYDKAAVISEELKSAAVPESGLPVER